MFWQFSHSPLQYFIAIGQNKGFKVYLSDSGEGGSEDQRPSRELSPFAVALLERLAEAEEDAVVVHLFRVAGAVVGGGVSHAPVDGERVTQHQEPEAGQVCLQGLRWSVSSTKSERQ